MSHYVLLVFLLSVPHSISQTNDTVFQRLSISWSRWGSKFYLAETTASRIACAAACKLDLKCQFVLFKADTCYFGNQEPGRVSVKSEDWPIDSKILFHRGDGLSVHFATFIIVGYLLTKVAYHRTQIPIVWKRYQRDGRKVFFRFLAPDQYARS